MIRRRERIERRKFKSEINIVPLLDVLLVLILIFVTTTPIITHSIEINLPDASKSIGINANNNPLVIFEVLGIGQYSILADEIRVNQLSPEQIVAKAKYYLELNSRTIFLVGGAKNVPYDEIIRTLNLLHGAGVKSVGLITNPI